MAQRIVILGGGTGGTLTANRLRRPVPPDEIEIIVVDQDDRHVYQPGLLFVPFGYAHPEDIVRPGAHDNCATTCASSSRAIDRVDVETDTVHLADGTQVPYDVLIVATGAVLVPEETEGLTGPGWMHDVFTFYDLEGAAALGGHLAHFDGGRARRQRDRHADQVPVAPLEFCFLADWFFRERGIRDAVEHHVRRRRSTARSRSRSRRKTLGGLLAEKDVALVTEFNTGEVDGAGAASSRYDGREIPFDLAVVVPLHGGAEYVGALAGPR